MPISGGYDYTYYLSDHLGNTRVTFDTKTGAAASQQNDDYYPFGLEIPNVVTAPKNEYLYNGKELQEELAESDYGARFMNHLTGRWNTIDPHAESYQNWTTYNYAADNPILLTDPDGMDWFYHSADGKKNPTWVWHDGSTYDTGVKDSNGNNVILQGQQAVVVFNGSLCEKLGTKSAGDDGFDKHHTNGYIDGHGAVTANVTVYGPGGANDIVNYAGYSMSSDPSQYSFVADGDYNVNYRDPGKSGALHSNWAVNDTQAVSDYWTNPLNPDQIDENGHYYSEGIYIHTSNQTGYAGTTSDPSKPITSGCLLISPKDWKNFNRQLNGVKSFLLQIRRTTQIPYKNSQIAPAYNYFNTDLLKF